MNRKMDKHLRYYTAYSHNVILLSNKKEHTTAILRDTDVSQKHNTEWKESYTTEYSMSSNNVIAFNIISL